MSSCLLFVSALLLGVSFTPYRPFAKGPRFMNLVMTFVLLPLSHYNSITEPRARFLLSLLEHLTIDFPFHFILSIIDVHLDSMSRDKLIFPSAITRILCHFPSFDHFSNMCVKDYAPVKLSEAQFQSRQSNLTAPSAHSASSASAPSSSGDVSLGDIMAQLHRMDAHLDTLSTKLYQVNVCVGRITRRQATMAGFAPEPTVHRLLPWLLILRMMMMMMVMMMMLSMMLMEMLALPMRCLLDTLPFVTRDKKGK